MNVFKFSLLIILNFCIHCTSTYPLTRHDTANTTTTTTPVVETTETTAARENDATPDSSASSWSRDYDMIIALCVVPGLFITIFGYLVYVSWHYMSYKKALKDWAENGGLDDPRRTDEYCRIGPDGRAKWDDLYGIYSVQEAMDMINTFALNHHRQPDPEIGKLGLPLYSIKGKELVTLEHAFVHLHIGDRPCFAFEQTENDRSEKRFERWKRRKEKREKEKVKKAERETKRAGKETKTAERNDERKTEKMSSDDRETIVVPGSLKSDSSNCQRTRILRIGPTEEEMMSDATVFECPIQRISVEEEETKSDATFSECSDPSKNTEDVANEIEPPDGGSTSHQELSPRDNMVTVKEMLLPGVVPTDLPDGDV